MSSGDKKSVSGYQWPIAVCIILISCIFLFTPEYLLAKEISKFAIQWMFICLGLGIVFMFMDLEKLLYTSFICAGILAGFLLYSYNTSINHAFTTDEQSFRVSFVNPSLSTSNHEETSENISSTNADIIILEEVTPEWDMLIEKLRLKYKYSVILKRADLFGKAIFSNRELYNIDTLQVSNNLIILSKMKFSNNNELVLAVVNASPSRTMQEFNKLEALLQNLSQIINNLGTSIILGANLNVVPWDKSIRKFKLDTDLNSSRRYNNDGSMEKDIWSLFNIPKNEIFYSKDIECTKFQEINDNNSNPIGLIARYQFIKLK